MQNNMTYHHCMPFKWVKYGMIIPSEKFTRNSYDKEWVDYEVKPNLWLQKKLGFYPLFLSVHGDIVSTGYDSNWRKVTKIWYENGKRMTESVPKGEFANQVLFSFENLDNVTFIDYDWWFVILNSSMNDDDDRITTRVEQILFKKSWSKNKWIRHIKKDFKKNNDYRVLAIVPALDLKQATSVWVRNQKTKKALEKMGFKNVMTKRVKVEPVCY